MVFQIAVISHVSENNKYFKSYNKLKRNKKKNGRIEVHPEYAISSNIVSRTSQILTKTIPRKPVYGLFTFSKRKGSIV